VLLKASGSGNGGVLLAKLSIMCRWRGRNKKSGMAIFPGYFFADRSADRDKGTRYIPGACGLIFLVHEPAVKSRRGLEAFRLMMRSGAALAAKPKLDRKV
jgi:hypothetical protein